MIQLQPGKKVNKGFLGMIPLINYQKEENHWWSSKDKRWVKTETKDTFLVCRSIKAFRRRLKRAPKGVNFLLLHEDPKYSVLGIGTGKD